MASANISFDQIPGSIRKPGKYAEFNTKLAVRTLPQNPQRVIIAANKLAAGTHAALSAVNVFSDAEAATLFGRGSVAHRMVRAAIKANAYMQLSVIGVDDAAAGVAAAGAVTFTGPASSVGGVSIGVANTRVDIAVASGDTAAAIATAVAAAITANPDLPVTAAVDGVDTTKVNFTARNKGALGNGIKLAATATAAGVVATVTAMTGGLNDPDPTAAYAAIFSAGHNIVVSAWNDQTSLTALRTHLDAVSGPLEKRGARGVAGHTGTLAAATTLAGQIDAGRITVADFPGTASWSCELAAGYAAVIASEEDPARPLNNLEIKAIGIPAMESRLSRTEQENALWNGVTPLEVGPGDRVQIVRAISTYTLGPQGVDDPSLLDITTIATLDYVRKAVVDRISLRFPREKKTLRTKRKVRSEILDVLYKLEELEIVEAVEANKDGLLVEDDLQDATRLNVVIPCDVVNGLHIFAARIDLLL